MKPGSGGGGVFHALNCLRYKPCHNKIVAGVKTQYCESFEYLLYILYIITYVILKVIFKIHAHVCMFLHVLYI